MLTALRKSAIEPCIPTREAKVPAGPDWHTRSSTMVTTCSSSVTGSACACSPATATERPVSADHEGCAAQPQSVLRDRRRSRAAWRRRPVGFQRPAFSQARWRGRVLRVRHAGERRRGSPQAAAVDAQEQSGSAAGAPRRRHPPRAVRTGRDRAGSVSPRLPDGAGGAGLETPRQQLPQRSLRCRARDISRPRGAVMRAAPPAWRRRPDAAGQGRSTNLAAG